ncbi:hypothetical protein ACQBAT_04635 [Ornithinimicrobium sp. Y1847]
MAQLGGGERLLVASLVFGLVLGLLVGLVLDQVLPARRSVRQK